MAQSNIFSEALHSSCKQPSSFFFSLGGAGFLISLLIYERHASVFMVTSVTEYKKNLILIEKNIYIKKSLF